jgi:hypothetical protein
MLLVIVVSLCTFFPKRINSGAKLLHYYMCTRIHVLKDVNLSSLHNYETISAKFLLSMRLVMRALFT